MIHADYLGLTLLPDWLAAWVPYCLIAFGVWTAPRTWVAGEVVTAAIMNVHVRDNLSDLNARVTITQQFVQEDIAPTASGSIAIADDTTVLTMNPNGAYNYYGMDVPVSDPWAVEIINVSANNITLEHESGSEATPARRFFLPASGNLVLSLGEACRLLYISVAAGARWVATGTAA